MATITKAIQILNFVEHIKKLFPTDTVDAILDAVELKNPKLVPILKLVRQLLCVPDDDIDPANPV